MEPPLLSQHSSNPLEATPTDPRNRAYVRRYQKATRVAHPDGSSSSGNENGLSSETAQYQKHIADMYTRPRVPPTVPPPPQQQTRLMTRRTLRDPQPPPLFVDLDEDMSDEDELVIVDAPEEKRRRTLDDALDDVAVGGLAQIDADVRIEGGEDGDEDEDEDEEMEVEPAPDEEETMEEFSMYLKPREERAEIQEEIAELEAAVPQLTADYRLIDRLGTGTFSSVYKAIDLGYHSKWDNSVWHGAHPLGSSAHYQSLSRPSEGKVFVAIKRIYVTSGPERIRNELAIMEDCRGCRHVSQLITAFRQYDQVVAIMPYHKNEDFRDFFRVIPLECIKAYFRCMFRALRDIHTRGIIHRDVKPANFLFDPRTGTGTLCDFGLACRIEKNPSHRQCLHSPISRRNPHGKLLELEQQEVDYVKKMQRDARIRSGWPSDRVGYPKEDQRPHSKANRAGTRGFRAPEVLLKCGDQSGAIDVWSTGMILLFFLTGKFPLLNASDDVEALVEIATIIGKRKMERTATLHSRTFQTNVPSISQDGMTWREFVEKNNPDVRKPRKADPHYWPYNCPEWLEAHQHTPSSPTLPHATSRYSSAPLSPRVKTLSPEAYAREIDNAFDLLEGLMAPECVRRTTPRDALAHPFLREPDEPDDDEYAPHLRGEGVCAEYHFIDENGDHCVNVRNAQGRGVVRRLESGEGMCIGRQPCEFHSEGYDLVVDV